MAHHGNIKDKQFGFSYMQQFDVVFNALDASASHHAGTSSGSIFAVLRRVSPPGTPAVDADALQVPPSPSPRPRHVAAPHATAS